MSMLLLNLLKSPSSEKQIHNYRKVITEEAITLIYKLKAITVRSDNGSLLPIKNNRIDNVPHSVKASCQNAKTYCNIFTVVLECQPLNVEPY
jgi:hypothetical protein